MILQTDRKQRNYNYLSLIKGYNTLLKNLGKDGIIKKKEFYSLVNELIGVETADAIYEALIPDEDFDEDPNSLELFEYVGNGEFAFTKERKIFPVASKEEAEIVYSMLLNGDFDLIMKSAKSKLKKNLDEYFENINEQPFNLYEYIEVKGQSISADSLVKISATYKTLKKAIELNQMAKIKYCMNDNISEIVIQPIEFIYSQLDLRMRVKAFVQGGTVKTFYLSYVKELKIVSNNEFKTYQYKESEMKELIFTFSNIHSLPERVAARFSDYKKLIKYNKKNNSLTYKIYYTNTPTENSRILNRLLSLGDKITIQSSEKNAIKEDALKTLNQYK